MTRKILFGALTLALFVAGFGVASFPALAELRIITITLEGGQEVVTTVDVPPGTPPEAIQLPEISAPIKKVEDGGPRASRRPRPTRPTAATTAEGQGARTRSRRASSSRRTSPQSRSARSASTRSPATSARPTARPPRDNPTLTLGLPGPAPVGVPNFVINKFRIPPFLLPIYQAAGTQYGIRWEVLAAINEIETDYGRNLNVSSAGALGWMQFIPSSWRTYGVDANSDGEKDPYNPVDAIFAAARYLKAAGAEQRPAPRDLRLQPRRLVRRLGDAARAPDRRPARRPGRLAHRPDPGPLPRPRQGALRRRPRRARPAPPRPQGAPRAQRRRSSSTRTTTAARSTSTPPRRSGDRRQRRRRQEDRQEPQARPLHRAAGRLRQPLHLRAPRQGLQALPGAEAASTTPRARDEFRCAARSRGRGRACRSRPRPPAPARSAHGARAARAAYRASRAGRQPPRATAQASRARSACSPTRRARRNRDGRRGDRPARSTQAGFEVFSVYFSKVLPPEALARSSSRPSRRARR